MTEKQKYIGAYLDGYFSDKKLEYGLAYFNALKKATKKANKKYKQYKKPIKSICAININIEEHIANGKLMALAPELLLVCKNALRDVKAMNEWMVSKGHHGYTLLEQDLQNILEKTEL